MARFLGSMGVRASILVLLALPLLALPLLALPLLALAGFGGWAAWQSWRTAAEMRQLASLAELASPIGELVHDLQKERGFSAGFIGARGQGEAAGRLARQYRQTDSRMQALDQVLVSFDPAASGADFATRLRQARAILTELDGERGKVEALRLKTADMARYYTGTIAELLGLVDHMSLLSNNARITTAIAGYMALLQAKERAGIERAMGPPASVRARSPAMCIAGLSI